MTARLGEWAAVPDCANWKVNSKEPVYAPLRAPPQFHLLAALFAALLAKNVSEALVYELRREKVGCMIARLWKQLYDIHADNFLVFRHGADE